MQTGTDACASSAVSAGTISTGESVESVESVKLELADVGGAPTTVPMAMARAMMTASAPVKDGRRPERRPATDAPLLTLPFYVTGCVGPTFEPQLTGYPRAVVSSPTGIGAAGGYRRLPGRMGIHRLYGSRAR